MAITAGIGWGQQDEQQGFCQLPQAFLFPLLITQPGVQQERVLSPISLIRLPENMTDNNPTENRTENNIPENRTEKTFLRTGPRTSLITGRRTSLRTEPRRTLPRTGQRTTLQRRGPRTSSVRTEQRMTSQRTGQRTSCLPICNRDYKIFTVIFAFI